jgi:hypothetical protein
MRKTACGLALLQLHDAVSGAVIIARQRAAPIAQEGDRVSRCAHDTEVIGHIRLFIKFAAYIGPDLGPFGLARLGVLAAVNFRVNLLLASCQAR